MDPWRLKLVNQQFHYQGCELPMAAMREGTTRGMMMHFNMLRNSSPMNFTYIASL